MIHSPAEIQEEFTRAAALLGEGEAGRALSSLERLLRRRPHDPVLLLYSGVALFELKRFQEACDCYRKALVVKPDFGEAYNNLGNGLVALGDLNEAVSVFRSASRFLPLSPVPLCALAAALQAQGAVVEAVSACREALGRDPGCPEAHWNLALALLLLGCFREGWRELEWRWEKQGFTSPRRNFLQPLWDGSPLAGRTILLHAEQGLGDAIQFIRYVPLVSARGGRVLVECHPQLVSLFRTLQDVMAVIPFGQPLPPFVVHAPLLSLPGIFGTEETTIPRSVPYLSVPPDSRHTWSALKLPRGLKVGVVWAGNPNHPNDDNRSLPQEWLVPLIESLHGFCHCYSLQLGGSDVRSPLPAGLVDLTQGITDFSDTAAIVERLDLILCVDTSVAHLTGALGKPVWVMLPYAPDWRWLLGRSDSPWYPTMRLFRQHCSGDWSRVVSEVAIAVHNFSG